MLALITALSLAHADIVPIAQSGNCQVYLDGSNFMVVGCNLRVQDGAGATETTNGLGNVIIGYDENGAGKPRSGSHNLIVGPQHGYSSHSGIVAGYGHTVSGTYAGVVAGSQNSVTANGGFVGGSWRTAVSGQYAAALGGRFHVVTAQGGAAVAGDGNDVGGLYGAAVAGGQNTVSGEEASVVGGFANTAYGVGAVALSGDGNFAGGVGSAIVGSVDSSATGVNAVVIAGLTHVADEDDTLIGGGAAQNTSTPGETIIP